MKKLNKVLAAASLGVLMSLPRAQALSISLSDTAPTDRIEISSVSAVDPGSEFTRTSSGPGQTFTILPGRV